MVFEKQAEGYQADLVHARCMTGTGSSYFGGPSHVMEAAGRRRRSSIKAMNSSLRNRYPSETFFASPVG